jgi:hypothetical protein
VARRLGILCALALLAAGCGVRTSKPFTAAGTAGCLRSHGFTQVTTNPGKVGFIAGFADLGGIRATSPTRNVLTIAFTADASSTGDTEDAFRAHAPKRLQGHITDIMSTNRNAVLVWTITPRSDELDTVNRCLEP